MRQGWSTVLAALILAIGLVLHALLPEFLPRYEEVGNTVIDNWTGHVCRWRDIGTERCAF